MAKVILLCGKICSGKTTYANSIRKSTASAILSVDEIMLSLFGQNAGEKHDEYVASLKKYILAKSAELAESGINVIIDTGLWTKAERQSVRDYFNSLKITNEIHYLDISDTEWKRRIEKRNREITENNISAYYVDDGLAQKVMEIFEKPDRSEVDVWIGC